MESATKLNANKYPAKFTPTSDSMDGTYFEYGYVVTFRDVPEAITQGESFKDALDMATEALVYGLEFYIEQGKPMPEPTEAQHGEVMIDVLRYSYKGGY